MPAHSYPGFTDRIGRFLIPRVNRSRWFGRSATKSGPGSDGSWRNRAGPRPLAATQHPTDCDRSQRLGCAVVTAIDSHPMSDACCEDSGRNTAALAARHRGVLWTVLAINLALFVLELSAGLRAGSSALLGDSLDMLGDSLVYAASLAVVGRNARAQARVAVGKGVF